MGRKHSQWTYDLVVEEARLKTSPKYLVAAEKIIGSRNGKVVFSEKLLESLIEGNRKKLEVLENCRPIAIGPATFDSLINETPDSYEYLKEGKLPFDKMFFEFVDPVKIGIPLGEESLVSAIRFHRPGIDLPGLGKFRTSLMRVFDYQSTIYFKEKEDREQQFLTLYFRAGAMDMFSGYSDKGRFHIDFPLKRGFYTTIDEQANMGWYERFFTSIRKAGHANAVNLDQFPNKDSVITIANLCTNIINYINSQNTVLIPGSRKVTERQQDERGTIRNIEKEVPFYIVDVKHRVAYEEPIPNGHTGELNERLYVRGHPRRYRNEDGKIREVIWIDQYIKGPPNAPWRNQRHRLMAEKIERERAVMNKLIS